MAYVRSKMIRGNGPYYYLVKSERVGTKNKQIHIAYLGKNPSQKSGSATAKTLSSVEGKDINTTYDIPNGREKSQDVKKMVTKEKIMELGKAVGKVEDNGFNVTVDGNCVWHKRYGITSTSITVLGDTYPIKDEIKAAGGVFGTNLAGQKGWTIPITDDNIDAIIPIVSHRGVRAIMSDR